MDARYKALEQRVEGYWRRNEEEDSELPFPVPNVLTEKEAKIIYELIVAEEKAAVKEYYRGISFSRITGEPLGNAEYETRTWKWPGDFAKHYVLEHKVKPTDEFLYFIGYKY